MHTVKPECGFEMSLNSDFPVGSGLGGSASLSAVVLGCFNMLREDQWNQYELAEIAFQSSAFILESQAVGRTNMLRFSRLQLYRISRNGKYSEPYSNTS